MRNYTIRFGTNINHEYNYEQAKRLLIMLFGSVEFSESIYSRDYNAAPDDEDAAIYLNFEAKISTSYSRSNLKAVLKKAERDMGRKPERKAIGIIDADFDIL